MKAHVGVGGEGAATLTGVKSLGSDELNCQDPRGSAAVTEAVLGIFQKSRAEGEGGVTLEIRNNQCCSEFF